MKQSRAAWETFVERCSRAETFDEISSAFRTEMKHLGFGYIALCSHVDPLKPPPGAVAIFEYPEAWLAHFSAEKYQRFDPVFMEATRRETPFFWNDPVFAQRLSPVQKRILNEGAEVGLAEGFTIPIHGPNAIPASCSLVPVAGGVDPLNYSLAHSMAVFAHESARRILLANYAANGPSRLSKRERECLTLAAQGKSDWAISEILGISERTAHHAIERAKVRLGVATRVQAIVRALMSGEIAVDEMLS